MSLPNPYDDPAFYDHLITKRLLAWMIDLIVTMALVLVVLSMTAFLTLLIFPVIWVAVVVAYRTVMLTRFGATAGMMVAAIKLRRLDASWPEFHTCLWHSLLYALSMMFVIPQIGSVTLMLTTPYKQGLNDWLLGTTLVNHYLEH